MRTRGVVENNARGMRWLGPILRRCFGCFVVWAAVWGSFAGSSRDTKRHVLALSLEPTAETQTLLQKFSIGNFDHHSTHIENPSFSPSLSFLFILSLSLSPFLHFKSCVHKLENDPQKKEQFERIRSLPLMLTLIHNHSLSHSLNQSLIHTQIFSPLSPPPPLPPHLPPPSPSVCLSVSYTHIPLLTTHGNRCLLHAFPAFHNRGRMQPQKKEKKEKRTTNRQKLQEKKYSYTEITEKIPFFFLATPGHGLVTWVNLQV